jgi:hypothetical protein
MRRLLVALALALSMGACTAASPLQETRVGAEVLRSEGGQIQRSSAVVRAFQQRWACPATHQHTGACPGWAVDHVIPLACGGLDAVSNLQWLPNEIKSAPGALTKDRFERWVYGGANMSPGCP